MKKLNIIMFFAAAVLFGSGCVLQKMIKRSKDQDIGTIPSPLELHGGKVSYQVKAVLPPKILPKGKVYTVKTFYKYGVEERELGEIPFRAEDHPNSKTSTTQKTESFSFDFDPSFRTHGDLLIQGVASNPATGKFKTTEKIKISEGVLLTSELVEGVYDAVYADHGYIEGEELIPTNVEFFFQQGSAAFRTSEKRSGRARAFNTFLAEKNVTRTVKIVGMHSPEGTEAINTHLSETRPKEIEKWYRGRLRRYDYKDLADDIVFTIQPVVRDFAELKQALKTYDGISAEANSKLLAIINGGGTFEDKERAFQAVEGYQKVLKDLYPPLRTARAEALSVKKKRPTPEIVAITTEIAKGAQPTDSLNNEELLFGATFTPSLFEREAIYKAAIAQQDTWIAHNNLASVYITRAAEEKNETQQKSLVDQAVTQLEIASRMSPNAPEVVANLAVVYLLQGNKERAYDNLTKATQQSPSKGASTRINAIKGSLEAQRGEYEKALASLGAAHPTPDVVFNRGLTLLLKKDYDNARTTLEKAVNARADYAKAHYCLAVIAARTGQGTDILPSLQKAVEANPALKERAIGDLEFKAYRQLLTQL